MTDAFNWLLDVAAIFFGVCIAEYVMHRYFGIG